MTDIPSDPTTELTGARNALAEARSLVSAGTPVRVLEPSPPAVVDDDLLADRPMDLGDDDPADVVLPLSDVPRSWAGVAAGSAEAAARARWLGPWDRLEALPDDWAATRRDYHRLAYAVVAMTRHAANGKFGLRFTAGGFGTPFFRDGDVDRQVRMVGATLVDQRGDEATASRPTSLRAAADALGVEIADVAAEEDSPPLGDPDATLALTDATGDALGAWFGFGTSVLEQVRFEADADADPEVVQLWPGHFDPAAAIGNADAGHRATFGASPGDDGSDEPYLYVGPWAGTDDDPYWNATSFPGAVLTYAELLDADDQRATALAFYRRARELLATRSVS